MQSLIVRPPRSNPYRPATALDVLAAVPDDRTAAAMDDAVEAQRLVDDLIALVDAGLVVPMRLDGQTRYAPCDPDDLAIA
jgi:hypothetical protein